MNRLISWTKQTVLSRWRWITNVRRSLDESREATDSPKPPEWYLDLATECMERAQELTSESNSSNEVKLNFSRTCKYLVGKLETAVEDSKKSFLRSSSVEHKAECLDSLKFLYQLAKEVESFIENCCKDVTYWIRAALTSACTPVHVFSLGYSLKLCTELLRNSNKLGGAWLTFYQLKALEEGELLEVKKMVSDDEDTLMSLLLKPNTLSRISKPIYVLERDFKLATILLKRSKSIQAMSSVDSQQLSSLDLWRVKREHLSPVESDPLGRGSQSAVYKAMWFKTVEVAEKVFTNSNELSPETIAEEVSVIAQMSHPNIVTFLGYHMDERSHKCSLVMEMMDIDLRLLMRQKMQEDSTREAPFSISVACDIMLQVAEALQYMHQNGVAHGNLKSTSILINTSKVDDIKYVSAKVANFGQFKIKGVSHDPLRTYMEVQMLRLMAPEFMGARGAFYTLNDEFINSTLASISTFKSDVYSFAMLCLEILTGNIAFSTIKELHEVRTKVLTGYRPELPSQCPHDLKNLIELCWNSEPNVRPSFDKICEQLWYIRCSSLLQEALAQERTHQPEARHELTLPIPTVFKGEYSSLKVVRQLGKGGLDSVTVYSATWHRSEGTVEAAQKTYIGSHDECFVNEVSIMAALEHPNVVRLLCYATDRRSCSIVMERMDGDLHALISQRRSEQNVATTGLVFDKVEAVHVMLQIARGMEYVHGKNVVHRDLKSCNILVRNSSTSRQLEVKVADFGLSMRMNSSTSTSEASMVGTIRWMAPEVMVDENTSKSKYNPFKSDVYSFGCLCYEILAARVPFYETLKFHEVKENVLVQDRRPLLPEWTAPTLKALIERCWQREAIRRPSFSKIVKELKELNLISPISTK